MPATQQQTQLNLDLLYELLFILFGKSALARAFRRFSQNYTKKHLLSLKKISTGSRRMIDIPLYTNPLSLI